MEILCKNNKNDLEQRIIRSLIWAGRSIEEHYLDLSCAEVAFAFESIFKSDKSRLITQSIQDQIAESTALILNNNYDDIINLPHYVSKKRPRMSMEQRAAQFAPFAALTGFEDEIEEAGIEFIKKMDTQ